MDPLEHRERERVVIAARCRDCGVETWTMTQSRGTQPVHSPEHESGCSIPMGRLDLQRALPEKRKRELFGDRLERPMSNGEMEQACETMKHEH